MIKTAIQKAFNSLGFDIIRISTSYSAEELSVIGKVKAYTATSPARIVALIDAVGYVTANQIPGAIVECGVWRGGSTMAALLTFMNLSDTSREVFLFDTFEGMSAPTAKDVMFDGTSAESLLENSDRKEEEANYWCYAGVESVRQNVLKTGYPAAKLHFVKGKVEDTLPAGAPGQIALLRLDTDWYESTKHEMEHLYPRLANNGVLIIDDYGHWKGARQAVDEYFTAQGFRPLLSRLDYTGRMMIKSGR